MLKGQKRPYYGKRTKKQVIDEYLNSSASMDELSKIHGVLGSNAVRDWLRKDANSKSKDNSNLTIMSKSHCPASEKEQRNRRYKTEEHLRISELEYDLANAQQRVRFYQYSMEILNDLAKELTGVDLLKKTGQALSKRSTKQG